MKPKSRFHHRGKRVEFGAEWWRLVHGRTLVLTFRWRVAA
jgi:hypothetical protein